MLASRSISRLSRCCGGATRILPSALTRRTTLSHASALSTVADDSHSDFKPKTKVSPNDPAALKAQIDEIVKGNKVVLFMKGTPSQPMCGFSSQVVRLLHQHGVDVTGVDVLSNPILRTAMKEYSSWPTFPQLYVAGEFVGGCDIATQMHQSGDLAKLLEDKVKRA